MALDRKDIRAKLDPDAHAALMVLCEVERLDLGEFIERELLKVIWDRVHGATVIAQRTTRLGISGSRREPAGKPGSARE